MDSKTPDFTPRPVDTIGSAHDISSVHETRQPVQHSWRHRLSLLTTTTLVYSCILVPAVIGILCFLWSNPSLDQFRPIWRNIVIGGWIVQTITISTVLLRTAVAGSAAIATSMIAAIILEGKGVSLHASAPISIFRYVNAGPQSLLLVLAGSLSSNVGSVMVAFVLFATTIVLQFTSTLLAWDLRTGIVVSPTMLNTSLSGMSIENTNASTRFFVPPYWMYNPQTFQTFAEHHESISAPQATDINAIRDTGLTHRAFIPESDHSSRTGIKEYRGKASVLDSRMVCVRPKMHQYYSIGYTNTTGWLLNGTFKPSEWTKGLMLESLAAFPADTLNLGNVNYITSSGDYTTVNLTSPQQLPLYATDNDDEWSIREKLMVFGPALVSTLDPRFDQITPENLPDWTPPSPDGDLFSSPKYNMTSTTLVNSLSYYLRDDPTQLMTGRSHVMMNISYGEHMDGDLPIYDPRQAGFARQLNITADSRVLYTMNDTVNPLVVKPQDEWLVFTMPQAPSFRVAMTLCFDSLISLNADILATTSGPIDEPGFTWDPSGQVADTEDLRRQIGVLDQAPPAQNQLSRGLWKLLTDPADLRKQLNGSVQAASNPEPPPTPTAAQEFLKMYVRDKTMWGSTLCTKCALPAGDLASIIYFMSSGGITQQVLQDVLRDVGNVSLAYSGYLFLMARMAYYDWLPYFDIKDDSMISWFSHAQFPQRTRGLIIVIAVLALHFVLVGAVILTFFTRTKVSRIGDNAWQCLAQAQSPMVEEYLKTSTMTKDADVKDLMSQHSSDGKRVKLKHMNSRSNPRVILTESQHEDFDGIQIERQRRGWSKRGINVTMV